jgi:glycosyltransferase involved in cell wall biosynthesis
LLRNYASWVNRWLTALTTFHLNHSVSVGRDLLVIIFLRSSDIGIDAKLRRYARALRSAGLLHMALFWDRNASVIGDDEIPSIRYVTRGQRKGKLSAALKLCGLNLFALKTLWQRRQQISLVHAIDFDTAISAWMFNRLTGVPFIYDIYDHYPDSRGIEGWMRWPFGFLERRIISAASQVILADDCRTAQHDPIPPAKLMVVENVPDCVAPPPETEHDPDRPLRIGYLGTLEPRFRGLEDLAAAVNAVHGVTLHMAGAGVLVSEVTTWVKNSASVEYHGPMAHESGLKMLAGCDIIAGLYYLNVANHRFAAPNKYFEHLLLGKPLLTSAGTPPGQKVLAYDTGWAVTDGAAPIRAALEEALAKPELLKRKGQNAARLWHARYAGYCTDVIEGHYVAMVKQISKAIAAPQSAQSAR